MRRGIFGLVLCLYSMTCGVECIYTQNRGEGVLHPYLIDLLEKTIEDQDGNDLLDDSYLEELEAFLWQMMQKGLEPNAITARKMEEIGLLDHFETVMFTGYIEKYGIPFSKAELRMIPGIDTFKLRVISEFMNYGEGGKPPGFVSRHVVRSTVVPETKKGYTPVTITEYEKNLEGRYLGNPVMVNWQSRMEIPGRASAIVTMERDPGEKSVDFFSAGVGFKSDRLLRNLVLGSYTAREGQGLVLWNGFSFNTGSDPSTMVKNDYDPAPYGSADENRAFNGIASTFGFGKFTVDLMLSSRGVDARIIPEGYTSLLKTGLHNTPLLRERKRNLWQNMGAATITFERDGLKAGIVLAALKESHLYAGRDSLEKKVASVAGKNRGNLSFHWKGVYKKFILYGEVALDVCKSVAVTSGLSWRFRDNSLVTIDLGYRDKGFSSPMSTLKPRGSEGCPTATVAYKKHVWNGCTLTLQGVLGKKYHYFSFRLSGPAGSKHGITVQGTSSNERILGRVDYRLKAGRSIELHTRCQLATAPGGNIGYNLHQEAIAGLPSKGLQFGARISCFSAESWSTRLYSYERDLLYQFRTVMMYGKGYRWYINIRKSFSGKVDFWFKYGAFLYSDRDKIGEGNETIVGRVKSEIKVQLRMML